MREKNQGYLCFGDGLPLPKGWRMVPLGRIANIFAGSAAPQGKEYFSDDGPCFLRVSDIGKKRKGQKLMETKDHLSPLAISSTPLVKAHAGTIVFPKSGAAISTNCRAVLGIDMYIVSHLMAVKPKADVSAEWLLNALCQINMMDYSDNDSYPSLKKSTVENIQIPLPPLPEQKRIAAILKEQMEAVELARAAAEAQLEAAQALSAAYLREVFPQPGQELPKGWKQFRLGDICRLLEARSISSSGDAQILAVTTACLTEMGFDPAGLKSAKMHKQDVQRCELSEGEVLIARSNTPDLVGRVSLFPGFSKPVIGSDLTIRVSPNRQVVLPSFLASYLSVLYINGFWKGIAGGASSSMKKITRKQIQVLLKNPWVNHRRNY